MHLDLSHATILSFYNKTKIEEAQTSNRLFQKLLKNFNKADMHKSFEITNASFCIQVIRASCKLKLSLTATIIRSTGHPYSTFLLTAIKVLMP